MSDNNKRLRHLARLSGGDWDKIAVRAGALMAGHQFGCSEALLLAFQEALGSELLPTAAIAMSSAFRGGQGGAGCLCGALAAGQMLMGAVFGYYGDSAGQQDPEAVKRARLLYKELHDRFREAHKSTCCRVLTKGLDHNSPERKNQCARLVKAAAGMTSGVLAREAAELA
ncbi:MAG: C-GCAxxG-C-C family protein [Candidatus Adiutrix sp.]|jgi:C_GCAxxG_C_C family probable redox protein|nr:C-GCAxxG-C-C family protein [Candidatus Adiutrix sp.]